MSGSRACDVTVVITAFNAGAYLGEAIDSVLEQTCVDWRLLIVDDASSDGSITHVADRLADPRIMVVANDHNQGQARSLNIALERVDTPLFLKLDADDWLADVAVERLLAIAKASDQRVGFFVTSVVEYNQETGSKRPMRLRKWGRRFENRYELLLANLFPFQICYRTAALKSVGGWPTNPEANVEDLAIFLRLIERYRYTWVDELLYFYRQHARSMTREREKTAAGVEWLVRDALERWGGEYEPIFADTPDGWRILARLNARRR